MASLPAAASPVADRATLAGLVAGARFLDRGVLLETEAMALLEAAGFVTPRRIEVASAAAAGALASSLPGGQVVLKVVSPDLPHKTERGGVAILDNRRETVAAAAREMERRFAGLATAGFVLYEYVPHAPGLGHEFLLGARWTREFGPVVTLGPGGIHAEFLGGVLREDQGLAIASPALAEPADIERAVAALGVARLATEPQRGRSPEVARATLVAAFGRFVALAKSLIPEPIAEIEINPLVVSQGRLVALDALVRLTGGAESLPPPRPVGKIGRLLAPRTIAVAGVSEKMNPGRVILQNILKEGFPPERVTVVKPGLATLDGCRCVASLADLGAPVDLAVLSLPALQSAEMVAEIADRDRAESVVLIASGLEEKSGMEGPVARMHDSLRRARATPRRGPVVNGGNCLGVRSVPGRINTLFIPEAKLPLSRGGADPVALLTASGAFAVSKASKLAGLNPRFTVTLGNQMDLTVSDYLEYLAEDDAIEVFGIYLEGFRPLDGARFLELTRRIVRRGRTVLFYRAGRTREGADAAASHTAALAGDYRVARRLVEAAGAVVAESLEDFEDLVRLFTAFRDRPVAGWSLGGISNAGYECVTMADGLGPLRLAEWTAATRARLSAILERARLSGIVSVRNPLDLTPILGDEGYGQAARAMLEDPRVDVAVVGCVPLTPALDTLPAGPGHAEDLAREGGIVSRLARLWRETRKPWVVVVDAGRVYDPMVDALDAAGIPTFRAVDRALRLLGRFCACRLGDGD